MIILLFLLVFGYIIYYIVNLLLKKRLTETFTNNQKPRMTIDDSHYFLTTSILPGKIDIVNLKEKNPNHSNYYYVDDQSVYLEQTNPNVVSLRQSKMVYPQIKDQLTCIGENEPVRHLIQEYQPYMYDQPELLNYYDFPFYRDWRYPERPIDIRFAVNPQKYCEENPHIYPAYKYFSKW